jgi:hypothetical protein
MYGIFANFATILMKPFALTLTLFLLFLIHGTAFADDPNENVPAIALLSGYVLEKGTRKPLEAVHLFLEPTGENVLSNDSGFFEFPLIPPGSYLLFIAAVNYKRPEPMELLLDEEGASLNLYLDPEPIAMMEIVVETERKAPDPGRQTLKVDELQQVAGTGGDVIMAIQTLPGVAPPGGFSGSFLTRGSGPFDNTVLLDQMPVFQANHIIGFVSTINSDLIHSADFYSGGFSSRYGNTMGGVIDITSRAIRTDRLGFRLDLNPAVSEGRIEGPLNEDSQFYAAARRSFLQYIISDPKTTVIPIFNDYQIKWNTTRLSRHQLSFLSFGSYDSFFLKNNEVDAQDPLTSHLATKQVDHIQGLSLKSHYHEQLSSTITLYNNYNVRKVSLPPDLELTTRLDQVRLIGHFVNDRITHRPVFGFEIGHGWYKMQSHFVRLCGEGEPSCNFTHQPRIDTNYRDRAYGAGTYLEDTVPLTPRWDVTAGGRIDYFYPTRALNWSPRLSTLFHLNDSQRVKAAYGYYYQWPNLQGEFVEGFGTPTIGSNRSIHYVTGYEHQLTPALDLDLQLYHKDFNFLIVPSNKPGVIFDNDGVGYAQGAEVLLRHQHGGPFFGWFSYAYSKSKRQNHPEEAIRISDYDRPHAATWVASYQWEDRIRFGGKFRYLSGSPYTPIVGFAPNANGNIPIYGRTNSDRLPSTHQLDLKWEYKKRHNEYITTSYLEVWNVYNHQAIHGFTYNNDFSVKKPERGLGLIPFAGVTIEF